MNEWIIFSHRRDIALPIRKKMHSLKTENCVLFRKISEDISPEGSFLGGSHSKESACDAGDVGSIARLGISPGERDSYPLQYSCLENPTDSKHTWGAWWAVHEVAKSQTGLSWVLTPDDSILDYSEGLFQRSKGGTIIYSGFFFLFVCFFPNKILDSWNT